MIYSIGDAIPMASWCNLYHCTTENFQLTAGWQPTPSSPCWITSASCKNFKGANQKWQKVQTWFFSSSQTCGYQETNTLQHLCHNFASKSQIIWKECRCPSQMFDSSRHLKLALSGSRQVRKNGDLHRDRTAYGGTQLGMWRITAPVSAASTIRFISTNTCQHDSSDLLQQINIFSRLSGGRFLREMNVKAPISCSESNHLDFLCDSWRLFT